MLTSQGPRDSVQCLLQTMLADMCSGISAACLGSSGVLCSLACIPQTILLISLGLVWAGKMQCPHSSAISHC